MKSTKKIFTALLLSGSLATMSLSANAGGGIPTFDAQQVYHSIQQGLQMAEQIRHQLEQIRQLKAQIQAISGTRDVGSALAKTLSTASQIGNEWTDLYSQVRPTGTNGKSITDRKYSGNDVLRQILVDGEQYSRDLLEAKTRVERIVSLGNRVLQTQDAKAAADLANQIAVESAYVQAMHMRLDTQARISQNQSRINAVRYRQQQQCFLSHMRDRNFKECM